MLTRAQLFIDVLDGRFDLQRRVRYQGTPPERVRAMLPDCASGEAEFCHAAARLVAIKVARRDIGEIVAMASQLDLAFVIDGDFRMKTFMV